MEADFCGMLFASKFAPTALKGSDWCEAVSFCDKNSFFSFTSHTMDAAICIRFKVRNASPNVSDQFASVTARRKSSRTIWILWSDLGVLQMSIMWPKSHAKHLNFLKVVRNYQIFPKRYHKLILIKGFQSYRSLKLAVMKKIAKILQLTF